MNGTKRSVETVLPPVTVRLMRRTMPATDSPRRFVHPFLVKSMMVALLAVFAGAVTVVLTRPQNGTPLSDGRESEVRVRAAFEQRLTLSVPNEPTPSVEVPNLLQPPVESAERTSRAPHVRPPGAEPPEYTPIPATKLPTEPVVEPAATPAVRAMAPRPYEPERASEPDGWKRDPRFAQLAVDVRGGTAVIGGRARSHEAAWELAEQVRTWPAVERVVVGRVDVK